MKVKFTILLATVLLLVSACSSEGLKRGGTLKHADRTREDNLYAGYGYVSSNDILCHFGAPSELKSSSSEKLVCIMRYDNSASPDYWYAWFVIQESDGQAKMKTYYGRYYKDYENNSSDTGYVLLKENLTLNCEIYDDGNLLKISGTLSTVDNTWSKKIDELLVCMKYEPENGKSTTSTP